MKPTMNLRFVFKAITIPHEHISNVANIKTIKVLQQQFEEVDEKTGEIKSEWKDIPTIDE